MAKKKTIQPKHFCRECRHAIEQHNRSFATGKYIMAKCKIIGYDVLLSSEACDKFKEKQLKNG